MSSVFVLTAAVLNSTVALGQWLEGQMAGLGTLPALAEVQEASEAAMELPERALAEAWDTRARWRGLVPDVWLRFGSDAGLDLRDPGAGSASWSRSEAMDYAFDARVAFELGDLVFSRHELAAAKERRARGERALAARARATELYFELLRAEVEQAESPSRERLVELRRLEGLLMAHTGGRLSIRGRRGGEGGVR